VHLQRRVVGTFNAQGIGKSWIFCRIFGAPDRIRTCDPCLRRAFLYQTSGINH